MNVIAWDTETARFRDGVMAPELSCVTWQYGDIKLGATGPAHICDRTEAHDRLEEWLKSDCLHVGQHIPYDFAVAGANFPDLVPLIFQAYNEDRVTDTKIRQQLLDIANGHYRGKMGSDDVWVKLNYGLGDLVRRHTGRMMIKDGWRMFYGEFLDVPIEEWPKHARTVQLKYTPDLLRLQAIQRANPGGFTQKRELADLLEMISSDPSQAVIYPLEDASGTLDVFFCQENKSDSKLYLQDQFRQSRSAWALHLAHVWGIRTNEKGVRALELETQAALSEVHDRLVAAGLVRKNGTRDTKAAKEHMEKVCAEKNLPLRLTETKNVCLDEDACKATEDPLLKDYAELSGFGKVLSNDVKALLKGVRYPVHTNFGMAASGRTTSSKPNIQNIRRLPGIRECFVPRDGMVFIDADFSSLELHALAQLCIHLFGQSKLGEALNAGIDPHTELACSMAGITYEEGLALRELKGKQTATGFTSGITAEGFDDFRQSAKVANFGIPGGLGFAALVTFAWKTYGVRITVEKAKEIKAAWLVQWPEMKLYFDYVNKLCQQGGPKKLAQFHQIFSNRFRGGCSYTAACNTGFQGLGVDAAKRALYLVTEAMYTGRGTPLYGSRVVNFVHDQIIAETRDIPRSHDAAIQMETLMVKGATEFLPDVPPHAKPHLMKYWSKNAKAVYGADGRLVPWDGRVTA